MIHFLLPDKNTIKLLRIPFSLFLMPVFLLALSQVHSVNLNTAIWSFLIIHLLIYPSSNGYNSYIDKDESSIGGLEKPPMPTIKLFYLTLVMDALAIVLAFFMVSILFALCLILFIMVSRAYSSKLIRLKKYPIIGLLVVVVFQGAFTYYISYIGISGSTWLFNQNDTFILLACSLQIAGAYPLTQIYQHREDLANGDITISARLGYTGTFLFSLIMFVLCAYCYYLYFEGFKSINHFLILQIFFLPVIIYFLIWFMKVIKDQTKANYKNTMRMNLIASVCMSACFMTFTLIKYLK